MKKFIASFLLIFPAITWGAEAKYTVATQSGRNVTVEFVTDDIVKVTNTAPGETAVASTGLTVLSTPATFNGQSLDAPMSLTLVSPTGVTAIVDKSTGGVTLSSGANRIVCDNGARLTKDNRRQMRLSTVGEGSFYGAGERGYNFNLDGDTLVVYNRQNYGYTRTDQRIRQMNITMPLFISSNGYAILFDDYAAAEIVMKDPIVYTTESPNPISYYFINGAGSLEGVVKTMSSLTGRQGLPPFWALGYITSKYGYHTEAETRGVIDTLKTAGYPVDGVVLDLYWYGKEQDMGRLAWDPEQWPNYKGMLSDLKKKGVNTVIISQPYVLRNGRGLDNYNELAEKGLFVTDSLGKPHEVKIWVGEGGMFDVSNPATRKWLRDRYKLLTDEGVGGWWGDLGEPEVHPETGFHANGLKARQYHNKYGNDWSSIISELYAEEYPDTRLMTLMRGGTTGLQRFNVFPWSTDVSRSWGGLQPQVMIMLNSGLSGLGYMSHDVGGFAIDPDNPVDPELYVRWLQLGLFTPVLRTHAQAEAEPFKYTDLQHIIKPLIEARYRWLPYNYTLAYENATQGLPLVRPLNFYTPGSAFGDDIEDEYLWGSEVLVAPVLKQGATKRPILFPEGRWIDMANPTKVYKGGEVVMYDTPLEVLPVFARAGAFIPFAPYKMENTGDYRTDIYEVNYYPLEGIASSFTMFEDDRTSPKSLEQGKYALVTFKGNDKPGEIDVEMTSEGHYDTQSPAKQMTLNVMNVGEPKNIQINGRKLTKDAWRYDSKTRQLTINFIWQIKFPTTLQIIKK